MIQCLVDLSLSQDATQEKGQIGPMEENAHTDVMCTKLSVHDDNSVADLADQVQSLLYA